MKHFWNNPIYPLLFAVLSTWTEPETCFQSTSREVIWPKKILNYMHGVKSAFLAIFQRGLEGGVQWLCGPHFAFFWPPPTYSGQTWTFDVPRGQFQNLHPQPLKCNHQYAVHFYQNYKGINMIMACKIKLYYSESDLKYEFLGIKNQIVDLLSLQTHIFWGYQYVIAYISSRRFDGYYSKIPISDQYFYIFWNFCPRGR